MPLDLLPPCEAISFSTGWTSIGRRSIATNGPTPDPENYIYGAGNCPDDPAWAFFGALPYRTFGAVSMVISGVSLCPGFSFLIDPNGSHVIEYGYDATNIIGRMRHVVWGENVDEDVRAYVYSVAWSGKMYLEVSLTSWDSPVFPTVFRIGGLPPSLFTRFRTFNNALPACNDDRSERGYGGTITLETVSPILSGVCLPSDP